MDRNGQNLTKTNHINFDNFQAETYRGLRRFEDPVGETEEVPDDQEVEPALELVKPNENAPTTNGDLQKLRNFCMRYGLGWYKICHKNNNVKNIVLPQLEPDLDFQYEGTVFPI